MQRSPHPRLVPRHSRVCQWISFMRRFECHCQQPRSSAHLRARFSIESSQVYIRLKKKEILLLKTQLADAQAEAESSRSYAQNLAEEKMALLVKVEQERADAAEYKASCHWAVKYLEAGKNNHFAGLEEFRQRGGLIALGWLAAMSTLESQEVKQSFGDVVKFALARGKAEAVECNFMKEGAEGQPDYFLKPDVAQLHRPESLEAHAIRLAKKKGVKGKAILCGVGDAHIPHSDGVPVSVATVSPKDSELLGKLEEAGNTAYQVGSSERSRCHSI
ncbi:hypothetical protein Tco_0752683 [Tanacetum coccineum]|uniref:Uncharacterized protein n=1 Tax=Tanacetum coccineum TaxID=301880 RepID=A0ABQ4ZAW9_9ASTR